MNTYTEAQTIRKTIQQDLEDDIFWIGYDDAMNGHPKFHCCRPVTIRTLTKYAEAYQEGYAAASSVEE